MFDEKKCLMEIDFIVTMNCPADAKVEAILSMIQAHRRTAYIEGKFDGETK